MKECPAMGENPWWHPSQDDLRWDDPLPGAIELAPDYSAELRCGATASDAGLAVDQAVAPAAGPARRVAAGVRRQLPVGHRLVDNRIARWAGQVVELAADVRAELGTRAEPPVRCGRWASKDQAARRASQAGGAGIGVSFPRLRRGAARGFGRRRRPVVRRRRSGQPVDQQLGFGCDLGQHPLRITALHPQPDRDTHAVRAFAPGELPELHPGQDGRRAVRAVRHDGRRCRAGRCAAAPGTLPAGGPRPTRANRPPPPRPRGADRAAPPVVRCVMRLAAGVR